MTLISPRRETPTMTAKFSLPLMGLVLMLVSLPCALASNLNFTYRGPAGFMNEADWDMFRAEAGKMLNSGEDGQTYRWTNNDTGTSGSFTPDQTKEQNGRPCRQVTVTLAAGPAQGSQVMTVCKQDDDTWTIVK